MDYVQALFSFFIAPLFGTVILGCCGSGPRMGRISWAARRDGVFDRDVYLGPGRCRGFALHRDEFGREANGGEPVPRIVELDYLRGGYGCCESGDETSGQPNNSPDWCMA